MGVMILLGKRISVLALWTSILLQIRQLSVGITFISDFEQRERSYLRSSYGSPRLHHPDLAPTNLDGFGAGGAKGERAQQQEGKNSIPALLHPSTENEISVSTRIQTPAEITEKLERWWKHVQEEEYVLKVPFAIPRRRPVDSDAVTVAVHSDTSRFHRLLFLIKRWQGPVSASIYMKSTDDISKLVEFVSTYSEELAWTDIHVLMEDSELDYPHNLLREMALRSIETEYFLLLDVDFVTPPNASAGIHQLIRQDADLRAALHNRTWMVLPAFERHLDFFLTEENILTMEGAKSDILPKNKQEALKLWDDDEMDPFHLKQVSWGHGSTNFSRWYIEPEDRKKNHNHKDQRPSFYPIGYEIGFEPYVLGCKCKDVVLPKYWPGFRGFGYNKFTFFIEAHFMGFQFAVLEDYFVVHLPHPYGKRRPKRETTKQLKRFTMYMKDTFNITKEEEDEVY